MSACIVMMQPLFSSCDSLPITVWCGVACGTGGGPQFFSATVELFRT